MKSKELALGSIDVLYTGSLKHGPSFACKEALVQRDPVRSATKVAAIDMPTCEANVIKMIKNTSNCEEYWCKVGSGDEIWFNKLLCCAFPQNMLGNFHRGCACP